MQRQQPSPGALNLDHVAHFVPDADAASAALEQLGFTLTPFSVQQHRTEANGPLVPAGTGNRCVMLKRGYVEILTPLADTPNAAQLRAAIARYTGVHLVAFGTVDPQADHARLAAGGFAPVPVVDLQRQLGTPDGEATARFSVVRPQPGRMPEGRIQFCHQRTPERVWQQRWVEHANSAAGLAAVLLCVADPDEAAQRYRAFTGVAPRRAGKAWRLGLERGSVLIQPADSVTAALGVTLPALPWIAGYVLECEDLGRARAAAASAGCRSVEPDAATVAVIAPAALGGVIVFRAQDSQGTGALAFG
ncbi:MAG TPA: VOC family protein [Burkholderiales bacterium]|nr:VOC family protein [Burkholderiales bacterium]